MRLLLVTITGPTLDDARGQFRAAVAAPTNCQQTYAREFRYDSGRARYLVRSRDPSTLLPVSPADGLWTDYDGESTHGDFTVALDENGQPGVTDVTRYLPGHWQQDVPGGTGVPPVDSFVHGDQIGSTRQLTGSAGTVTRRAVYTAFGELVHEDGTVGTRYGYGSAWGYEGQSLWGDAGDDLGFLHVGERLYDPATGRFLQRDPIGARGGFNVYVYCMNRPTQGADPSGRDFWDGSNWFHEWIAINIWGSIHSTETLANMSGARATAEAVGASVAIACAGYGLYWGASWGLSSVSGWGRVAIGCGGNGLHVWFGSGVVGWLHIVGEWVLDGETSVTGWIFKFPVRYPDAAGGVNQASSCFWGAVTAIWRML